MHIAVKGQADDFRVAVNHRAAGVAADDIVGSHKIIVLRKTNLAFGGQPRRGQRVWLSAGVTVECTGKIGEWRNRLAALEPAFHRAIAETQRAGGIGINLAAELRKAGTGDQFGILLLDRGHFVFKAFANRACL